MSYLFSDLQTEVKARATFSQSGTEFDTQVKNVINTSLLRVSREAPWRVLRRRETFATEASYTTGTGAVTVTNNSSSVSVTGATLITDGIQVGRRVDLGGSSLPFVIDTITGETTFTVKPAFDGTTSSTQSYKIFGREEYNLPIQSGRISQLWHEDYGYPFVMYYVTNWDFYRSSATIENEQTPAYWTQWGEDDVINQPRQASVLRIYSSSSADTSKSVTIFGTVSNYPDFEVLTTNGSDGTTAVSGSKSFTKIDRVIKGASTTGRLTIDANSANTTIAVLPTGNTTGDIKYKKIRVWPLPTRVFNVNVEFYKDPFRLVDSGDAHELGMQFDEAIILLATSRLLLSQGKSEDSEKFYAMYVDEVKSLRKRELDTILEWTPSLRRARYQRNISGNFYAHKYLSYTQLGGSYGPLVG